MSTSTYDIATFCVAVKQWDKVYHEISLMTEDERCKFAFYEARVLAGHPTGLASETLQLHFGASWEYYYRVWRVWDFHKRQQAAFCLTRMAHFVV